MVRKKITEYFDEKILCEKYSKENKPTGIGSYFSQYYVIDSFDTGIKQKDHIELRMYFVPKTVSSKRGDEEKVVKEGYYFAVYHERNSTGPVISVFDDLYSNIKPAFSLYEKLCYTAYIRENKVNLDEVFIDEKRTYENSSFSVPVKTYVERLAVKEGFYNFEEARQSGKQIVFPENSLYFVRGIATHVPLDYFQIRYVEEQFNTCAYLKDEKERGQTIELFSISDAPVLDGNDLEQE